MFSIKNIRYLYQKYFTLYREQVSKKITYLDINLYCYLSHI